MTSREILTMRCMEWERCKGSLQAILASFWEWDLTHVEGGSSFGDLSEMVDEFIREFGEKAELE